MNRSGPVGSSIIILAVACMLIVFHLFSCGNDSGREDLPTINEIPNLIEILTGGGGSEMQGQALLDLQSLCNDGSGQAIIEYLKSDDDNMQTNTCMVIGVLIRTGFLIEENGEILTQMLRRALSDNDSEVRKYACHAIGDIILVNEYYPDNVAYQFINADVDSVVGQMVVLLDDQNVDVRVSASNVLNYLGSVAGPALSDLSGNLYNEDLLVRLSAAFAIVRINSEDTSVIPVLIEGLEMGDISFIPRSLPRFGYDDPLYVAGTAANALSMLNGDAIDAIPALVGLLDSDHDSVRTAARDAIIRIDTTGEFAIPLLINNLSNNSTMMLVNSIDTIRLYGWNAKEAAPYLESILQEESISDEIRELINDTLNVINGGRGESQN